MRKVIVGLSLLAALVLAPATQAGVGFIVEGVCQPSPDEAQFRVTWLQDAASYDVATSWDSGVHPGLIIIGTREPFTFTVLRGSDTTIVVQSVAEPHLIATAEAVGACPTGPPQAPDPTLPPTDTTAAGQPTPDSTPLVLAFVAVFALTALGTVRRLSR